MLNAFINYCCKRNILNTGFTTACATLPNRPRCMTPYNNINNINNNNNNNNKKFYLALKNTNKLKAEKTQNVIKVHPTIQYKTEHLCNNFLKLKESRAIYTTTASIKYFKNK